MSSTTALPKVRVINHNDGLIHVHSADCQDYRKAKYSMSNGSWTMEAGLSRQEIANDSYFDQIAEGSMTQEMALSEHKFFPCVEVS